MKHKLYRTLVALCLILVLVVNVSPLRVQAMGLAGAILSLPAIEVVSSIVVGLGVVGITYSVFEDVVTRITDRLTESGRVTDGMIDVGRFTGVNGQGATYGVPQDVVSDVFDAMYQTGAVTSSQTNGFTLSGGTVIEGYKSTICCPVNSTVYFFRNSGTSLSVVYISETPFEGLAASGYGSEGAPAAVYSVDGVDYYCADGTIWPTDYQESIAFQQQWLEKYYPDLIRGEWTGGTSISVADGLGAAQIAPQGSDLAVGYPQWVANTINYNIDGQSIPYLPVGLGTTYEDTIAKTQEEIWAGTSEYQADVLGNWDLLLSLVQAIKTGIQNVVSAVRSIPDKLAGFFTDVITAIQAIPGAFAEFWQTVIGLGQDILSNVISIPIAIAQAIAGVLVDALTWAFAISDTFVATKVEALTLKYPYLETFHALGADLKGFFAGLGSRPPVIYINLGAATGSIYWGGSQPFLDLSWYAAYKPTMDSVLGGFLWLAVAWRTYLHLPGLISGASGVLGAFGAYNRAQEAEMRRAEYQRRREENQNRRNKS